MCANMACDIRCCTGPAAGAPPCGACAKNNTYNNRLGPRTMSMNLIGYAPAGGDGMMTGMVGAQW